MSDDETDQTQTEMPALEFEHEDEDDDDDDDDVMDTVISGMPAFSLPEAAADDSEAPDAEDEPGPTDTQETLAEPESR